MASERKSTDAFETALKREIQRTPAGNGADCPAPDVIAAYYDRVLARAERTRVDTHLLSCVRCQSIMAAIARADDSERSPQPEPARWLFWVTRLVAPVAVVGFVIAIVIGMRTREQPAPEVIALASPAPALQPQIAEREVAPAPPPQALPEQLAPSVAQPATPPAAMTLGKPHHKAGSREKAAIARKPQLEELTHEEIAKAEPQSALSEYSSSSSAAKSAGALASASPGAPLEAASASAIEAGNASPSEAPVIGAAIPSVAGTAASAPALQTSTRMALAQGAMQSAGGAGTAVSRSVGAIAEAPRLSQISSPDGSVAWQFGAGGAIMRSGNSGPWLAMRSGVTTDLLAASAPSNEVCWMVGKSGTIVRTLDGGAHWQLITPPSRDNFTVISATDSNNARVIAASGQSFVTHDGGVTWSSP